MNMNGSLFGEFRGFRGKTMAQVFYYAGKYGDKNYAHDNHGKIILY